MRKSFNTAHESIWFTSDLHFGHEAMLRTDVCKRPFVDVDKMDRALIDNWNHVVEEDDHIFVLGDFSFRSPTETLDILAHLKGKKHLLLGNHDRKMKSFCLEMFDDVADYREIDVDDQRLVLCHFAFRSWNRMHYGSWNLHGHSHGTLKPEGKQLDVGVDACVQRTCISPAMYLPMSFAEIALELKTAPISVVDHHTPRTPE